MTIAGIIILLLSLGLNIILFCGVMKISDRLQDATKENDIETDAEHQYYHSYYCHYSS